jgi:hypothetical protein
MGDFISAPLGVKYGIYIQRKNAAGQTLTASANNAIQFDTAVVSAGISYDSKTFEFTLPIAGIYSVSWSAALTAVDPNEIDMTMICSEDTSIQYGNTVFGIVKAYNSLSCNILTTATNRTVKCNIYKSPSATANLAASAGYNHVLISLTQAY